jgi:hypothetical protein
VPLAKLVFFIVPPEKNYLLLLLGCSPNHRRTAWRRWLITSAHVEYIYPHRPSPASHATAICRSKYPRRPIRNTPHLPALAAARTTRAVNGQLAPKTAEGNKPQGYQCNSNRTLIFEPLLSHLEQFVGELLPVPYRQPSSHINLIFIAKSKHRDLSI